MLRIEKRNTALDSWFSPAMTHPASIGCHYRQRRMPRDASLHVFPTLKKRFIECFFSRRLTAILRRIQCTMDETDGHPSQSDLSLPNGTPADTSSPASSSSLLNRLQLDDDMDGETRDLFVTVDDPKKHVCTMETYITYRVMTKTTRSEFDLPEYSIRRRYQDFDWIRNKLEETQPTHFIPPLPEKFVVKGVVDRFSEEFVETRRRALDKFLKRIADHPVLSFNEHFNVFLTSKESEGFDGIGH
ncbi:unnamed protein product [Ranitomeya imitator]|uniref:PX domain-containing protein n=1 Tax=Ranitomeya imitator TaxID=111125 RepID=A0ABN9LLF3_9NEOB|nr:unnamed protein product [Ranitomeya imitator]